MRAKTAQLWSDQDRHPGDRHRLFRAVADATDIRTVLYPGSYVDIAPSFVWPEVTYVDVDHRAKRFFDDTDGVREPIADRPDAPDTPEVVFVAADYTDDLPLPPEGFDLLISLYAGLVSRSCTGHLGIGGSLLVNPSHGERSGRGIAYTKSPFAYLFRRIG